MARKFARPVNVSPLIRLGRWCVLTAGVGYGWRRRDALQRYEDERGELKRHRSAERLAAKNAIASDLACPTDTGDSGQNADADRPAGPKDDATETKAVRDETRHTGGSTALQQYDELRRVHLRQRNTKRTRTPTSSAALAARRRFGDWTTDGDDGDNPFVFPY